MFRASTFALVSTTATTIYLLRRSPKMIIGTCECCDRTGVPLSRINQVFGIETFACYVCLGDTDPDPYGELVQAQEEEQP
jgi:hypothetical protein